MEIIYVCACGPSDDMATNLLKEKVGIIFHEPLMWNQADTLGPFYRLAIHHCPGGVGGAVSPVGREGGDPDFRQPCNLKRGCQRKFLGTPALSSPSHRDGQLPPCDDAGGTPNRPSGGDDLPRNGPEHFGSFLSLTDQRGGENEWPESRSPRCLRHCFDGCTIVPDDLVLHT